MKTKLLALLLLFTMLLGMLAACSEPAASSEPVSYKVMLFADEHCIVEGSTEQTVAHGEDAVFYVTLEPGYELSYLSHGEYDPAEGILYVENITAATPITMQTKKAENVAVSIATDASFSVNGSTYVRVEKGSTVEFVLVVDKDYVVVSVDGGVYDAATGKITVANVQQDTRVTVTTALKGNVVKISFTGNNFSFNQTGNTINAEKGQPFSIFPILDKGYGIVSVQGATFNPVNGCVEIANPQGNMSVVITTAKRTITYHDTNGKGGTFVQEPNFTFYSAPNTLWDDGSFVNSGYALAEYSIAPDGSVECYSLGSKVAYAPNQANIDLWCIWRPETSAGDFTYENHTFNYTYSYKDWSQGGKVVTKTQKFTGVAITSYTGNASTVVIPATLGGKAVIGIKAGAFKNKSMTTLMMTKGIKEVQAGAFQGCSNLNTLYFSDSILSIPNNAFDSATYSNLHNFYLNATRAPGFTYTYDGMYRVKWDAVVTATKPRLVIVGGSSVNYGVSSAYLEALLNGEYDVINYGTIRTTCQRLYVEALASQLGEGDIFIYAPENSSAYTMGSGKLDTFKIFRDVEGVYNVFRHVDIANYSDYFAGITDFNAQRYTSSNDYDGYTVSNASQEGVNGGFKATYPDPYTIINQDGDMIGGTNKNTANNGTPKYSVNFSEYVYDEADSSSMGSNINDYADKMKAALALHTAKGVKVFFGFAPVNENALVGEAKMEAVQKMYDADVAEWYGVEVLGSSSDHVFSWRYISQNDSHHLTDEGRVLHTFQLYLELCEALDINGYTSSTAVGTNFPGCKW